MICQHQNIIKIRSTQNDQDLGLSLNSEIGLSPDPFEEINPLNALEFQNCKDCGVYITFNDVKAIKDYSFTFPADVSPAQMLNEILQDEKNYELVFNSEANEYLKERAQLVNQIFEVGRRFKQRNDTIYLAVEFMDRYFLSKDLKFDYNPKNFLLQQITSCLLASKYDELDEQIPLIKDFQRYFTRILPVTIQIPTFDEVIECERKLTHFLNWDLMIVLPSQVVKLMLANGILFSNESFLQELQDIDPVELAKNIATRVLDLNEYLVKERHQFREKKPSHYASAIIYAARKQELSKLQPQNIIIWPSELEMMTKYCESELLDTANRIIRLSYERKNEKEEKSENRKKENQLNIISKQSPPRTTLIPNVSQASTTKNNTSNSKFPLPNQSHITVTKPSPRNYENILNQSKQLSGSSPFKNKSNIPQDRSFQINNTFGSSQYQSKIAIPGIKPNSHQNYQYTSQHPSSSQYSNHNQSVPQFYSSSSHHAPQRSLHYESKDTINNHLGYNNYNLENSSSFLHDHIQSNNNNASDFIPLRQKTNSQAMQKIPGSGMTSNDTTRIGNYRQLKHSSDLSRQYGNGNGQSMNRDYEINKLQTSMFNKENVKLTKAEPYNSRMPALRDSTEYQSSVCSNNLAPLHTTRYPHPPQTHMKPRGYEYYAPRENSLGKLPQIDVGGGYNKQQIPSTVGAMPSSSKYSETTNTRDQRRSKSWKRHDEEYIQSMNLRGALRKDSQNSRFSNNYNNMVGDNNSRTRKLGYVCQNNNPSTGGFSSNRGCGNSGTGATGDTSSNTNHYSNNINSRDNTYRHSSQSEV